MSTLECADHLSLLWEEYKSINGNGSRNKLIESYLYIVVRVAVEMKKKLPWHVELDDLISDGTLGLMDAIKSFDPLRDVKFETYCRRRIKGAILDELRRMDWVPRLTRHRMKLYNEALSQLSLKMDGHEPSLEQVAEYLGISLEDTEDIKREATKVCIFQEGNGNRDDENDGARNGFSIGQMADRASLDPGDEIDKKDSFKLITCLSDIDQVILTLYYRQNFTMKQIGELLGLSEGRVSQMLNKAILYLRDYYS